MDPKLSINIRISKVQHDNISFKNKRRRKFHCCAPKSQTTSLFIDSSEQRVQSHRCNLFDANKDCELPKHRWKLNKSGSNEKSIFNGLCMTNTRQNHVQNSKYFQRKVSRHNSPDVEKPQQHEINRNHVENAHHFISAESFQHNNSSLKHQNIPVVSSGEKKNPQRRDFVNCRKFFDWTTASSVRKLLPIFILVNMLPFLYAGESSHINLMHENLLPITIINSKIVVSTLLSILTSLCRIP